MRTNKNKKYVVSIHIGSGDEDIHGVCEKHLDQELQMCEENLHQGQIEHYNVMEATKEEAKDCECELCFAEKNFADNVAMITEDESLESSWNKAWERDRWN